MKLWHILGGITLSMALAGCVPMNDYGVASPTDAPITRISSSNQTASMPAVTGNVHIRQRIALPRNAVLTVTVSDASLADAPSKVITQRVTRTEGKQAPFAFELPYNPADIQPNARILLSAAIAIDNRIVMITENILPVINNGVTQADVTLVPVASVPLPVKKQDSMLSNPTTESPHMLPRQSTSSSLAPQPIW